jgi:hypothetical protein
MEGNKNKGTEAQRHKVFDTSAGRGAGSSLILWVGYLLFSFDNFLPGVRQLMSGTWFFSRF